MYETLFFERGERVECIRANNEPKWGKRRRNFIKNVEQSFLVHWLFRSNETAMSNQQRRKKKESLADVDGAHAMQMTCRFIGITLPHRLAPYAFFSSSVTQFLAARIDKQSASKWFNSMVAPTSAGSGSPPSCINPDSAMIHSNLCVFNHKIYAYMHNFVFHFAAQKLVRYKMGLWCVAAF